MRLLILLCIISVVLGDYYLLAMQKCPGKEYSIHGLWPQYNETSWPQYCREVPFDENTVAPARDLLDRIWYSCGGDNLSFWKHEIEKHYSCIFEDMSVLTYMKKAVALFYSHVDQCSGSRECRIEIDEL